MISKNKLLLALGVAGLALFSSRGKSRKMMNAGDNGQVRKNLTSWGSKNENLPSTAGTTSNSSSPPM